jgi:hypothetical protein
MSAVQVGGTTTAWGYIRGFYKYLLGAKDGTSSKYDEIKSIMRRLLTVDPARAKYKLYVTGHSLRVDVPEPAVASQGRLRDITAGGEHRVRAIVCRAQELRLDLTPTHHESQGSCDVQIHHKRPRYVGQASPFGYMMLLYVGNCKGREEMIYFHTGIALKYLRYECLESNSRQNVTFFPARACV